MVIDSVKNTAIMVGMYLLAKKRPTEPSSSLSPWLYNEYMDTTTNNIARTSDTKAKDDR
jgi:hypothetical protein